jgi:hypothetical protein
MQPSNDLAKDKAAVEGQVNADIAAAEKIETETKSWFAANAKQAIAIAAAFSIVFLIVGVKIGEHLH